MSILRQGCVCGHDHKTHRGEDVHMCLECSCLEYRHRCQSCGEDAYPTVAVAGGYIACSRRCALQIEYAMQRSVAHA
jgi:hypothetical protein